jgi:dienelactone hydrolase
MRFRAIITTAVVYLAALVWLAGTARADQSSPTGQWYFNSNGHAVSADISDAFQGKYVGTLTNEKGETEPLDNITWYNRSRALQFRVDGADYWEWYSGSVVEGIFVGRFSHSTISPSKPPQLSIYSLHATGWNSSYLDTDLVPRVWEILIDNNNRARLRLDKETNSFIGRLKIYSTVSDSAAGEQLEYDLDDIAWDGTNLSFCQYLDDGTPRIYQAISSGRYITGTYSPGEGNFIGTRTEVLTYGLTAKSPNDRNKRAARTRRQLYHLMMADNPRPLSSTVTVLRSDISARSSISLPPDRDDDPFTWPQDYTEAEIQFDYTLPNPYGDTPLTRSVHAYLATPTAPPPASGKYPALLAVNGHSGSAWAMMNPDDEHYWYSNLYWYGDSYARRGYVVLAVDISHRPLGDRAVLYRDYLNGDDPGNGNGTHPAIKAPGFDSDWEEDGERSWDAMRAVDYLLSLPNVDPTRIVMTGLSMGGEVTAITGALDPRISMSIPAGFSPDLGVMLYHGNHPCWQWQHADIREYVDVSDYFALTAPRPLLIETGKQDGCYSSRIPPFSSDKQVVRRTLTAYDADSAQCNLYLHYDQHHYHVGDINPTSPTEQGIQIPDRLNPSPPWTLDWQIDDSTHTVQPTLFDLIDTFWESTQYPLGKVHVFHPSAEGGQPHWWVLE